MKEARYFFVPNAEKQTELPAEEALHAIRVLRLREGDEIFLMDGEGMFFRAEVIATDKKHCHYRILDVQPQEKTWHSRIHLAIAPTKMMERMEWMAEKATEVGFDELTFLECRNSERKVLRVDRIEKIAVSAVKQSRKPWLPCVNAMTDFRKFVTQPFKGRKYIAHCYEEIPRIDLFHNLSKTDLQDDEDVVVMIGPEGDFSIDEVQMAIDHGFVSVSLGESRLRTETAGLSAVMMAQLCLRKVNSER